MEYVRCDVGKGPRFAFADPLRERDSEDGGARLCRKGGCRLGDAANAQGLELERLYGRPILSSFHAAFSAGGLAGAGVGALVAGAGIGPRAHFKLGESVWFRPGIAFSMPIDDPMSKYEYKVVQLDLPVAF